MQATELWLSLDLSNSIGSVALTRWQSNRATCLSEVSLDQAGKHSESLLPTIDAVLKKAEVSFSEVDRYITTNGPGSFTGLRIAFAALKAFALASGKPVELVNGHESRALHFALNTQTPPKNWNVSTQLTRDVFLVTSFALLKNGGVETLHEATASDLPVDKTLLTDRVGESGTVYPLTAKMLAETLLNAKSRQTLTEHYDIAASGPCYFGSKFD